MNRTFALVAVWLLFAATAVGVGFAAAGFIDQPLAAARAQAPQEAGPGTPSSASGSTSNQPSPRSTSRAPKTTRPTTRTPGSSATTPRSPRTSSTSPSPPADQSKPVNTSGGYVVARCSKGLVTLSASPHVGWELKDLSSPGRSEGRARFEQTGEGDAKVEVTAVCTAGAPAFTVTNDDGSDDDGSDRDSGDGDGPED